MSSVAAMWLPLLFGFALFLGAALLFVAQTMIGRAIVPQLGGNPLAWSSCLVFFQATLLAGYLYADRLHRFRGLRWQPWLHLLLLATAAFLCFIGVFGDRLLNNYAPRLNSFDSWPIFSTLCLLFAVVGLPCLVLAAVNALVQRWFAHLDHPKASDPYFLFVASNLGALAAVVLYPLLIEPNTPSIAQWMSWKLAVTALGVLLFLVALCAWMSPRNPELEPPAQPADPNAPLVPRLIGRGPATWRRGVYWLAASAIPVGLLMSATDYLTRGFASAAILWALPLALYLIAFAQAFAGYTPLANVNRAIRLGLQCVLGLSMAAILLALAAAMFEFRADGTQTFLCGLFFAFMLLVPFHWLNVLQPITVLILVCLYANVRPFSDDLSAVALVFHMAACYWGIRLCLERLAQDRPAAAALTTYYCWIGLGGLCGALFQVLIAPHLFTHGYLEFAFVAALASTLRPAWLTNGLFDWLFCRMMLPRPDPTNSAASPKRQRIALAFDFSLAVLLALTASVAFAFRDSAWSATHLDIPLLAAAFVAVLLIARPLRFGMALTVLVLLSFIGSQAGTEGKVIRTQRTAFGIARVTEVAHSIKLPPALNDAEPAPWRDEPILCRRMRAGACIVEPAVLRRYPTEAYHLGGPVGQVMAKLDGFTPRAGLGPPPDLRAPRKERIPYWLARNAENAHADARVIASVVGMGAAPPGPLNQVGAAWSEPSYAFIGLGTGSLFVYARPFQHVDAYEFDPAIIALSEQTPAVIPYYQAAKERGVIARIVAGDPRRSLSSPGNEGFYHVLFIDPFLSEAMPVHLLTQEAIALYFQKLTSEGIVCIRSRHHAVDLFPVLNRIAQQLGLALRELSADFTDDLFDGSTFSTTWIVLARSEDDFRGLGPAAFAPPERLFQFRSVSLWTDEHANPLSAVRPGERWPGLIYGMLVILLLFAMLLGAIEAGALTMAPAPVKKPMPGR